LASGYPRGSEEAILPAHTLPEGRVPKILAGGLLSSKSDPTKGFRRYLHFCVPPALLDQPSARFAARQTIPALSNRITCLSEWIVSPSSNLAQRDNSAFPGYSDYRVSRTCTKSLGDPLKTNSWKHDCYGRCISSPICRSPGQ
jgi:hypothetical protein